MGRICVVNFISLDGVIQSPLSVDEDTSEGFDRGGWVPPLSDQVVDDFMERATTSAAALLLGRRTYESMCAAWAGADESDPAVAAMNRVPKYVVSSRDLDATWANSHRVPGDLRASLKDIVSHQEGDIVVFGSGELIQGLASHDLIDEYRLLVFPIILGSGKRMFEDGAQHAQFALTDTLVSPGGVAIHTYARHRNSTP